MNTSLMIPAITTAISIGLGCGTCCSPIISTFLSTYVVSHSNGVKKGSLSFASFFFGKMVSVSLLCMVSALTARQFISESGYIGSFNLRFFSQAAMSAIGAVMVICPLYSRDRIKEAEVMQYKMFKGQSISTLGLGGLRFPSKKNNTDSIDREKGQKIVDEAISCGINYFDTAHSYQNGDSERFWGEALSKYPRDRYYLATKFYVAYSRNIEKTFEEQLKRCRTDYFDFYLFHCLDEGTIDAYTDKELDYLGFLLKQKKAGRIRNIGFSSHASLETLERFLDWYDGFDMALIQLNYLDWTLLEAKRQYEILTEHGIPVWVMEPMKGGRLSTLNEKDAAILKAEKLEDSLSSWGFRFLQGLLNVHTVLSGMSEPRQVIENAALFDKQIPLTEREMKALQRAAVVFMGTMGVPCSGCRYCCSTCPSGLDIPLLIKGYNERNISGSTWKIGNLSETKSASECLACGACLKRCPQKINILEVMKKISHTK